MFDQPMPEHGRQRARGAAAVALALKGGRTRLSDLSQAGAAKAMLPAVGADIPEVVYLNTAGGLTGGDRLSYRLEIGPGAAAVATTQTAERIYRSAGGAAAVDVRLRAGAGATLSWLPQETILFDGAELDRETVIELDPGARCLVAETLVLGRKAMGETVARIAVRDRREIRVGGAPLLIEPLAFDSGDLGEGPGGLSGARALSTVVYVAPDAEDRLEPLRRLLDGPGVRAAASAWDGRLVLRATAGDAWPLRRLLARALAHLSDRPLPRVWLSATEFHPGRTA